MYETNLKVGEIVILKPKNKRSNDREGFKAFIEEIIVEPTRKDQLSRFGVSESSSRKNLRTHSGVFSLYGLEPNQFFGNDDWYVGDTFGDDFERTGESLSDKDFAKLRLRADILRTKVNPTFFKHDLKLVESNLGRESGRNNEEPLVV